MQPSSNSSSSQSDSTMVTDSVSQIDDIIGNDTTPVSTCSCESYSSTEILGKQLQTKKSEFDKFAPEFSTMALEDVASQSESDVSYDNVTQVTKDIKTPDEASDNFPQKVSQFDLFAPEFSTMAIEATAESIVEITTVNEDIKTPDEVSDNFPQKVSPFELFAPEFSTMSIEATAECVVEVTTVNEDIKTPSSSESSSSSTQYVNVDKNVTRKKSDYARFAPEFSTMEMECLSEDED